MRGRAFIKTLNHDLKLGFAENYWKYFILLGYFLVLSVTLYQYVQVFTATIGDGTVIHISAKATTADYLIYFYNGIKIYIPSSSDPFRVPLMWLGLQMLIALIVGSYPSKDFYTNSVNVITRTKSRLSWWVSKCIWVFCSVVAVYVLGLLVALIFSALFGKVSFVPGKDISFWINSIDASKTTSGKFLLALLLPFLVSLALSLVQVFLSFVLQPIMSFLLTGAYFLSSAYYFNPFLIGSYSMFQRNALFFNGRVDVRIAIIVCLIIGGIVIVAGSQYFQRVDLLPKKQ